MLGTMFETTEDRAVARVQMLLRRGPDAHGLHSTDKPTARQHALLRTIDGHRGLKRAISASRLASAIGASDREVRGDVRDLRVLFGVRIGSSRDQNAGGYYLITSTEELQSTVAPMLHQLQAEAAVIRAMCEPAELAILAPKLNLTLASEDPAHAG